MGDAQGGAALRRFRRFAAIDWSGARGDRLPGIAIATCEGGHAAPTLTHAPRDRWSRLDALDWLRARAAAGEDILIGADFSMGLPFGEDGYFPGAAIAPADARALWREIDERCMADPHLGASSYVAAVDRAPYFRLGAVTGARFASADRNGRLRAVERHALSGRPASCFNLVGASQVGLASLTGMRVLHRLAGAIPVWPFDPLPAHGPAIVEIYTSLAARAAGRPPGRAKMRTFAMLGEALAHPAIGSDRVPGDGAIDDHASDALLAAAWLRRAAHEERLWSPAGLDRVRTTEGWTFGVP